MTTVIHLVEVLAMLWAFVFLVGCVVIGVRWYRETWEEPRPGPLPDDAFRAIVDHNWPPNHPARFEPPVTPGRKRLPR